MGAGYEAVNAWWMAKHVSNGRAGAGIGLDGAGKAKSQEYMASCEDTHQVITEIRKAKH